jgi:hypothetical protein
MSEQEFAYIDDNGRARSLWTGRFVAMRPDEICQNGCERWGDWWIPADCATHIGGAA